MATTQLVSVHEYLHTSYEYDAEYVEGKIVERPLPKTPHSNLQAYLAGVLFPYRAAGFRTLTEQRIQTVPEPNAHFRIPDVCVTVGRPSEDILTAPPLLCVEILSPDDSALELRTKLDEYLEFGVQFVWVIDPISLHGEIYTVASITRVTDGCFTAGEISVDLKDA
jgi:Uma2 family endonuclease